MNDQTETGPPTERPELGLQKRLAEIERLLEGSLVAAAVPLVGFSVGHLMALALLKGLQRFPSAGGEISSTSAAGDPEAEEIRARIQTWAGGPEEARRWYRSQPIAAFGDRTAESLVKSGQASALLDYLDSIALGGFA